MGELTLLQTRHQDGVVLFMQESSEIHLTDLNAVKWQEGSLSRWLRLEVGSVVWRISPASISASLWRCWRWGCRREETDGGRRCGVMGCGEMRMGLRMGWAGHVCPMCRMGPCSDDCGYTVEVKVTCCASEKISDLWLQFCCTGDIFVVRRWFRGTIDKCWFSYHWGLLWG